MECIERKQLPPLSGNMMINKNAPTFFLLSFVLPMPSMSLISKTVCIDERATPEFGISIFVTFYAILRISRD